MMMGDLRDPASTCTIGRHSGGKWNQRKGSGTAVAASCLRLLLLMPSPRLSYRKSGKLGCRCSGSLLSRVLNCGMSSIWTGV